MSNGKRALIVGRNITIARKLAGMNQAQLGRIIGVPTSYLSEWEAGNHEPRSAALERIGDALDQPLWWFYRDHAAEAELDAQRRAAAAA
jgi:transcriptional regulator with XRE-family HTH domain